MTDLDLRKLDLREDPAFWAAAEVLQEVVQRSEGSGHLRSEKYRGLDWSHHTFAGVPESSSSLSSF